MYARMPPNNPRKRPAPPSPVPAMHQPYNAPTQVWGATDNLAYSDPSAFNMDYTGAAISQPQFDTIPTLSDSTQLARRPLNRQMATTQRQAYDSSADPWGQFGDESILDPVNGGVVEAGDENIEALEQKAQIAKREAQAKRKQIPPFVQKLSSFLDDGKNTDLIRWSQKGDSFIVLDEDEFAKTLIPELFKHNNYASFVRQLNMYGFHKRVGLSDNSMKASERKNKSPSEYYNPYFKQGRPSLLWLINKPKGGATKNSKPLRDIKSEDMDRDSDEDKKAAPEENFNKTGYDMQPTQAISVAPESGTLQRREMAVVQREIQEIQKQQALISQHIARLRSDHNNLYQQAVAFQTLHDRHENSINAILTFLATVYNRSIKDGETPANLSQMFSNNNQQNQQQQQGSVVDMGDLSSQQQQNARSSSPVRRQQRLLMAPPVGSTGGNISQASTPRSVEELFDTPVPDTPQLKKAEQDMMSLIRNTNAANPNSTKANEFPELVQHYENANGNSPLTPQQRSNMLSMMATQTAVPGSNNALVSPTPPTDINASMRANSAELEQLLALSNDNSARIARLNRAVSPMGSPLTHPISALSSPSLLSGSGMLNDHGYFTNNDDLNQFINTDAFSNDFYNGSDALAWDSTMGTEGYDLPFLPLGETDGAGDLKIEPVDEGSLSSPDVVDVEDVTEPKSPIKRRRKN